MKRSKLFRKLLPRLLSWLPALLWGGVIFFFSSRTWDDAPSSLHINDKVVHIVVFGILGAALAWGGRRMARGKVQVGLVLLGWLYAVSDEWHQSFIPGRDPSTGDFVADAAGITLGFLVAKALIKRFSASGAGTRGA